MKLPFLLEDRLVSGNAENAAVAREIVKSSVTGWA